MTDAEARIMAVFWDRTHATVGEVTALKSKKPVPYSTVQTMLRILERKGYAAHQKEGRAFVYRAGVDRKQARRRALSHLMARLFDNSPALLVLNVLEDERMDERELERLRKLIESR